MSAITKYFVGGELEAFYQGSYASTGWSTSAGFYDSDFSRGAVGFDHIGPGQYMNMPLTSAQNECWVSFQCYNPINGTGSGLPVNSLFEFCNTNLTPIYRIVATGGTITQPVIQFQYWNGSVWTNVPGTALVIPADQLHKWDFNIKSDASTGVLAAYVDGIPLASLTGNTIFTSPSSLAAIHAYNYAAFGGTGGVWLSEGMIFDVSTLGRRLYTLGETANGTNSQWTGFYTDINEVGTFNDSNFIQTGTVNQTSTFVTSTIASTAAQQYLVSGLVVAGRILIGAVGPQNMKGAVVVSGTTYDSTNDVANLLTNFGYTWADFPTNPNTGLDWTVNQINAGIETGWQSLT